VSPQHWKRGGLAIAAIVSTCLTTWAVQDDSDLAEVLHGPASTEHGDQLELLSLVKGGKENDAFELAFDTGDELFETRFNIVDGGGANVGNGQRFTRVPRADLVGAGAWANHVPSRATGPNAETCISCHSLPLPDGAGFANSNVHRDPLHSGNMVLFIERNTPHLFAPGALQRLAEEMTADLARIRDTLVGSVCSSGGSASAPLESKGISFGVLTVTRTGTEPCTTTLDTSGVVGVSADLVVRPFQWKGSVASLRDFNRDAAHNELGMQAVEIAGDGIDGDGDGVANELTIGDITSLAVYMAAQPRPTTNLELDSLRLLEPRLTSDEKRQIDRGSRTFSEIGCATCHVPSLRIDVPIFSEPSQSPSFRDALFPAGQDPLALGVDPTFPVTFDLTKDQPDNRIKVGNKVVRLGSLTKDDRGRAVVELFGDLRRHDLGPAIAETIDEVGTGASVFLTENLWGVGSTAPYLHDGRATTLTEAILAHGGEAAASHDAFLALGVNDQRSLMAFLNNLVLFKSVATTSSDSQNGDDDDDDDGGDDGDDGDDDDD